MRIGIDGLSLSETKTGVGHYTFELARALAHCAPADEFELVSPRPFLVEPNDADEWPSNLQAIQVQVGPLSRRWFLFGLSRYIKERRLALFHGTNYEVPLRKSCPTVLTIHDLSLLLHPETHEVQRVRRARRRLPLMTRAATMIVTPTESVRREVCTHLSVPGNRVVAVPEAPRAIFRPKNTAETLATRKRLGIEDDFLLFVGTLEPRKNLPTLVSAFREVLTKMTSRLQLVIAGQTGWLIDDLFTQVRELGLANQVIFTGYLPDDDLCALYSSCRVFVYPSLYEGFGLPPLEAMACGAPVIASRIPSIAEVVGEAAVLFAPTDTAALSRSILELLADEKMRQQIATNGMQRAHEFGWERTAQLMREVYNEALAKEAR